MKNRIVMQQDRKKYRKALTSLLIHAGIFAAMVFLLFGFVIGIGKAGDDTMSPAIREGDVYLYFKPDRAFNDGDAVCYQADGRICLGRVAAMPGVEIGKTEDGHLTINGNPLVTGEKTGIFYKTMVREQDRIRLPHAVAENAYFILGDKRNSAADSRNFGDIPADRIRGRVFTVLRLRGI